MSAPAISPVRPGDVVADKYVVERVIGAGGMGFVVSAEHRHVHHRVALKFLAEELANDPAATARFLREGQAAGAIRCEHVVRTIDVGTLPNGIPYLVMELLEGDDLARVLERSGTLREEVAVGYVLEALVAIAEAHALGIVHRDLKPSNLFLSNQPDGTTLLKVLDFGISKVHSAPGAAPSLTITGSLLGSPLYMSPEQIRSAKLVDQRSDIWSLGVILHELVTGRPPFSGEQVPGVLAAIVADAPPSVRSVRPELSQALEQVVLRCLTKDPRARYATAAEMAQALAPLATTERRALVKRIVATGGRAPGDALPAMAIGAVASEHAAVSTPSSAAATAEGWARSGRAKDSRVLRLTVLGLGALAVGGGLLWQRVSGAPSSPVAEPEAHSAAPRNNPAIETLPAPKPPEPVAADVPSPSPPPSANPTVARRDARAAQPVDRTKTATHAKVKPPAPAHPKPRDPSELIDDRR